MQSAGGKCFAIHGLKSWMDWRGYMIRVLCSWNRRIMVCQYVNRTNSNDSQSSLAEGDFMKQLVTRPDSHPISQGRILHGGMEVTYSKGNKGTPVQTSHRLSH